MIGRMERRINPQPGRESGGAEAMRLAGFHKAADAGAGRSECPSIKI